MKLTQRASCSTASSRVAGMSCASGGDVTRAADPVCAGLLVQRLGRHVEAVGPDDGAALRVDADLGKEALVGKRLGDAPPLATVECHVAGDPVLEGEAQLVVADDLDCGDVDELAGKCTANWLRHGFSLAQRFDRLQGFSVDDALPRADSIRAHTDSDGVGS